MEDIAYSSKTKVYMRNSMYEVNHLIHKHSSYLKSYKKNDIQLGIYLTKSYKIRNTDLSKKLKMTDRQKKIQLWTEIDRAGVHFWKKF